MAALQVSVAEKKAELEFLKMGERVHCVVGAQVRQSCIMLFLKKCTPSFRYLIVEKKIAEYYAIAFWFSEYGISYTHVMGLPKWFYPYLA